MRKKIIISIIVIILFLLVFYGFYSIGKKTKITETTQEEVKNSSTTEIPEIQETDEETLEVQEVNEEDEGFKEQGEVAYEGAERTPTVSVGNYAGLTYYSQLDSRWRNNMYSSINNSSQTIGTSGCGPTSSAMIVSSIKGTITPDKMANLYVNYGYRSANQGTYWSAFKWTADVFNIEYSECYRLDDVIEKLKNNNYVIASCNQGLFTYGGHFIVLIGVEGNYIKIYDPYLYNGKFDTASRRGKADVKGNTVYVTIDNFKNYANYQRFFCFKNDRNYTKTNNNSISYVSNNISNVSYTNYNVRVTANSGLNIRAGNSVRYRIVGSYTKNSVVTILATKDGWGKTEKGWISLAYTSRTSSYSNYRLGKYIVNTSSGLNVRSGAGTNYKKKKLYRNKTRFDTYEIRGEWARTPSGWVNLKYCKLVYSY